MARHTDAVCKLCRREGEKLFLKGDRCLSPKCAIERRNFIPGMHGKKQQFRRKMSDYGLQLREKQKARRIYGVLERQFRRYFTEAQRRPGLTGENLLQLLERRLDNVIYRMGFADSRPQARQLVSHGHFAVNGRKVDIPSYLVKPGDVVTVREGHRNNEYFNIMGDAMKRKSIQDWLDVNPDQLVGRVNTMPVRSQIDISINEQLIVEYYSR